MNTHKSENTIQRLFSLFSERGSRTVRVQAAHLFMENVHRKLTTLSDEHNAVVDSDSLRVSVEEVAQFEGVKSHAPKCLRALAATPFYVLSVKVTDSLADFFLFPAVEMPLLNQAETASRCKLKLSLTVKGGLATWYLERVPVSEAELDALLLGLFRDLTKQTAAEYGRIPEYIRIRLKEHSVTGVVKALLSDKQRLINGMVGEHENLRQSLAREIHDLIIGDLLFLERSLTGDQRLSDSEMVSMIQSLTARLRSVCADLAPRDLHDWGLPTMLRDLASRYSKRSNCFYEVECPEQLPEMQADIMLHVYRIIQECFTNAEKHSQASKVKVSVQMNDCDLLVTISDDGIGFDSQSFEQAREGGSGTGTAIMYERVQCITASFPASISMVSTKGLGTKVTLSIKLFREQGRYPDPEQQPSPGFCK